MRKRLLLLIPRLFLAAVPVSACLMGCTNRTKVDIVHDATASIQTKPSVVYVMDFDLDVRKIKLDPRRAREVRSASLVNLRHALGLSETPQEEAQDLVSQMSKSIVAGLTDAGLEAQRIPPGVPLAQEGWLVRGTFLEVDEGNRLQRALGSGGQADIRVAATVEDLTVDPAQAPLLQLDTDANSKSAQPQGSGLNMQSLSSGAGMKAKMPALGGSAAFYSLVVKYVLAGYDLDRDAKQTGAKIAAEVAKRVKAIKPLGR